jgi:hypothetical protein
MDLPDVRRLGRQAGVDAWPHRLRHHFSHTWLDRGAEEPDRAEQGLAIAGIPWAASLVSAPPAAKGAGTSDLRAVAKVTEVFSHPA